MNSEPVMPVMPGYGQIVFEGYAKRAAPMLVAGEKILGLWESLTPDERACWDGAAADLDQYLRRIPG